MVIIRQEWMSNFRKKEDKPDGKGNSWKAYRPRKAENHVLQGSERYVQPNPTQKAKASAVSGVSIVKLVGEGWRLRRSVPVAPLGTLSSA